MISRKVKSALLLLVGFVAGSLVTGGALLVHYADFFKDQYYLAILRHANVVYMLRSGRGDELIENTEASLRRSVLSADHMYG